MANVILSQIPLDELETRFREIVKEELTAHIANDEPEQLISPEQTRKIFSPPASKVTLIKWTKDGKLQSHRIGGRVYYKRSEVLQALHTVKKYGRA
jgi:hypothetical protein